MIDIDLIRKNKEGVIKNLAKRGVPAVLIENLHSSDTEWRIAMADVEAKKQEQNKHNEIFPNLSAEDKKTSIEKMKVLDSELNKLKEELKKDEQVRMSLWQKVPNLVMDDVPEGGAEDFKIIKNVPEVVAKPDFAQKDYLTLLPNLIDMERGGKVSGSRFVYLKGELARLELGLVTFIMDMLTKEGFTSVLPPVLIKKQAMAGMGYLDNAPEEIYSTQDDLYLVGTSEQSLGPMHMGEILPAAQTPVRYAAFSSCFRREAGSHGKDVKGILRLHQFDKVEMFSFTTPDESLAEHEFLLSQQEAIMKALELPYRVIMLAAKDLGMPSAKTYDIETWIPSEGRYRETHSTSNTTDYQARRLNIRVKTKEGDVVKAHMLNGTAVALSRILIALIENHQQADGSIMMPKALHPYLPFTAIGHKL